MSPSASLSRGSEWHKWDLHIHSPLSALNNQFPKLANGEPDWETYIGTLEGLSDIPAIAITDYFGIEGYKKERRSIQRDRIKGLPPPRL